MNNLKLAVITACGIIIVVVGVPLSYFTDSEWDLGNPLLSESEIKKNALEDVSYADLVNNNQNYVGKIIHDFGSVVETENIKDDIYWVKVATNHNGSALVNVIWINGVGGPFLKNDSFEFWGKVKGLKELEEKDGEKISVPEIDIMIGKVTRITDA